jgi:hypothetical protein
VETIQKTEGSRRFFIERKGSAVQLYCRSLATQRGIFLYADETGSLLCCSPLRYIARHVTLSTNIGSLSSQWPWCVNWITTSLSWACIKRVIIYIFEDHASCTEFTYFHNTGKFWCFWTITCRNNLNERKIFCYSYNGYFNQKYFIVFLQCLF